MQLSGGTIQALYNGVEVSAQPIILQVLSLDDVAAQDRVRTRCVFSDGVHSMQGMITSQSQDELAQQGQKLQPFTIIELVNGQVNTVHGKKILIGVSIKWLSHTGAQVGSPQPIDGASAKPTPAAAAAAGTSSFFAGDTGSSFATTGMAAASSSNNNHAMGQIYPISQLNPYQNKWTIRARVTNKGEIRQYNNAKGSGKLMSVDLLDNQGGEIRATMFNETLDKFAPMLEKGGVYFISGGQLRSSNKRYCNLKHEYELTFGSQTMIERCNDSGDIKAMQYEFTPIEQIAHKNKEDLVDILAVVIHVGELGTVNTKRGDQLAKRPITLLDQTARSIELTLWGSTAENFSAAGAPVLAVKAARVSDYANRSLSTSGSSGLELSPTLPEAKLLKQWYDKQGGAANISIYPLTVVGGGGGGGGGGAGDVPFKRIDEVQREQLGMKQSDVFECEVVITLLRHEGTWMYNACPKDDCKKKVTQDHMNGWRCEKCNQSYDQCNPRYVVSMAAADATGKLWFSLFNDEAARLLQRSAADALQLQQTDPKAFDAMWDTALYQTVRMKVKARAETYNEMEKVKYNALSINAVDWAAASNELLQQLDAIGVSA